MERNRIGICILNASVNKVLYDFFFITANKIGKQNKKTYKRDVGTRFIHISSRGSVKCSGGGK